MIRTQSSLLAIFLAAILFVIPANAYIRYTTTAGLPLFRGNASASAPILVHSSAHAGLLNTDGRQVISADSNPMQAITSAAAEWSTPETAIHFVIQSGTIGARYADGVSVATFEDTPDNRSIVGDAVAITVFGYVVATGSMTDTDVIFNPALLFSTTQVSGSYDIQAIAVHELGHALGVDHSPVLSAAMFPSAQYCFRADPVIQCAPRSLSADDLAFATTVYPGTLLPRGTIAGTVSNSAGTRITGGFVTAVDSATGVVIAGMTSLTNGTYQLDGVPAGSYLVYVQAANGSMTAANLNILPTDLPKVNTAFKTTFFGGNATPTLVAVTRNSANRADISVAPASGAKELDTIAVGLYGADIPGVPWPLVAATSGRTANIFLWGKGIDESVTEDQLRLFGPGITLRPGSLHRAPDSAFGVSVPLEFSVDLVPLKEITAVTVGVVTGNDGSMLAGGLILLPAPPQPILTSLSPASAPAGSSTLTLTATGSNFTPSSSLRWNGVAKPATVISSTTITATIPASDLVAAGLIDVLITDPTTGDSTAPLTFSINAVVSTTPSITEVVSGASFTSAIAPGSWITLKGTKLSDTSPGRVWTAAELAGGVLPTSLDGVTVKINGKLTYISYISPTQINVLAPGDIGTGLVSVVVTNNGKVSSTFSAFSQTYAPAFFPYDGTSYVIASHFPDYALLGNPAAVPGTSGAKPGDIVILWGTGFGPTTPDTPNGQVINGAYWPTVPPTITLNDAEVHVIGVALTSGSVGLYQLAFQLPVDLKTGDVTVRAKVGGVQSPTGFNIFVQQ